MGERPRDLYYMRGVGQENWITTFYHKLTDVERFVSGTPSPLNSYVNRLVIHLCAGGNVIIAPLTTLIFFGVVLSFWDGVQQTIREVLGNDIEFTVLVYLFIWGVWTYIHISKTNRNILKILMTACKTAITNLWLVKDPPTVKQWMYIIINIRSIEWLTIKLRLQGDNCRAFWAKWDAYLMVRGGKHSPGQSSGLITFTHLVSLFYPYLI